jgi:thiol-disulfide isomerase/thioredoxin
MRYFCLALAAGCTPHLVSLEDEISGLNWESPSNSWGSSVPPSSLVGEGFSVGQVPHDFRLVDQHGEEVALWQFYGSVILLDISTMWCGPCQQIAQEVTETWEDYRGDGFIYLTVLPEDLEGGSVEANDLTDWTESFQIEAPVLADNSGYGYEVEPNRVWPVMMLIDRKMTVAVERIPPVDTAIRSAIEAAL